MPITYHIDGCTGLLSATGADAITDIDVAGFVSGALADPQFARVATALLDFSGATFGMPSRQIPALARLHRELMSRAGPTKIAVVVPGDLNFGLTQMYAHHMSGLGTDVQPFRDEAEALAWLRGESQCEGPN